MCSENSSPDDDDSVRNIRLSFFSNTIATLCGIDAETAFGRIIKLDTVPLELNDARIFVII